MKLVSRLLFISICFISITRLSAIDLYWIGGTGDWNSPANWSTISGGAGGAGLPTSNDNVFFDANSFTGPGQIVSFSSIVLCNDMIWSGVTNFPTIASTFDVQVSGSLTFDANMTNDVGGNFIFNSANAGRTIISNGIRFLGDVVFNNLNGEWIILDDFYVERSLDIRAGTLIADNITLNTYILFSVYTTIRTVSIVNSMLIFDQRSPFRSTELNLGGSNMTLIADGSTLMFTGGQGLITISGDFPTRFEMLESLVTNMVMRNSSSQRPSFEVAEFFGNADFFGNHVFNQLILNNGFTYFFENNSRQVVSDLMTFDPCAGLANVLAMLSSPDQAIIEFTNTGFVSDLYIRGIRAERSPGVLAGQLTFSTIDGGNNSGWGVIDNTPGNRTLYWVGGTGDWRDTDHWSTTSGGPGGQCPPVNSDNVVFDDNSFNSSTDVVSNNAPVHVNSISYLATNFRATLQLPEIFVNDNLNLRELVDWQVNTVILIGNDEAGFMDQQEIFTGENILINMMTLSKRSVALQSNLLLSETLTISATQTNGTQPIFETDGFDIVAERIFAKDAPLRIDFFNSNITINGNIENNVMPLVIEGIVIANRGNPTFDLTGDNTGFQIDTGPLGRMIFSNEMGNGQAVSSGFSELQLLRFEGDGQITGLPFNIDSLIFSEGHSYMTQDRRELIVNDYFEAFGGICLPVSWSSTSSGSASTLSVSNSTILNFQYVEFTDIRGSLSNPYMAGIGAVDVGGNSGWQFPDDSQMNPINSFLGDTIRQCSDEGQLTLIPFDPDDISSIIWSDGSTDLFFDIPMQTGKIFATVTLPNSCVITDTVDVIIDESFELSFGGDTTLCAGDELIVSAEIENATYQWQDNSTNPTFTVTSAMDLAVLVERGVCSVPASRTIDFIEVVATDLGEDQTICEGSSINLNASSTDPAVTYLWQDGQTSPIITASQEGRFVVELSKQGCTVSDDVQIFIAASPTFELPTDTMICEGQTLTLTSYTGPGTVSWNNGIQGPTNDITESGIFIARATLGTCSEADTTDVTVIAVNEVNLGSDTTLCQGETLILNANTGDNVAFVWSDGSNQPTLEVTTAGLYEVTLNIDICSITASIDVGFDPLPELTLITDTVVCEGSSLLLRSGIDSGTFLWSDGSTAPTLNVTESGTYSLEIQRGACTVSGSSTVEKVTFEDFNLGNDTIICGDLNLTLQGPNLDQATWNWSDGSTGQTLDVTRSGVYSIDVQIGDCVLTDLIDIEVVEPIFFNLGMDTTLCEGESITLETNLSTLNTVWSTGETNQMIDVTVSGSYSVSLSRQDVCFAADTVDVGFIQFDEFTLGGDTTLCVGLPLTLDATIAGMVDYQWQDNSNDPILIVDQSGQYFVNAGIGRCSVEDTINVTFQDAPSIDLGQDTTFCEGGTLTLNATVSNGMYIWSDGTTNATINVSQSDLYFVIVDQEVCSILDSIRVTVEPLPQLELGEDINTCEGEIITLGAIIPNATYLWQDNTTNAELVVSTTDIYSVVVNLGTCIITDSIDVLFNPLPFIDLGVDQSICEGENLTIGIPDAGDTYLWSTNEVTPNITVSTDGQYVLTLTSGENCSTVDSVNVDVRPAPIFDLGNDRSFCEGESTNLMIDGLFESYSWSTGEVSQSITVSQPTIVIATTTESGCTYSDSVQISEQVRPVFDLGSDLTTCEGTPVTLDAEVDGAIYTWSTGETTPNITVEMQATYSVIVDIDGCSATDMVMVTTMPTPNFDLGTDRAICEGEETTLSIGPNSWNVSWSTGDLTDDIVVSNAGNFTATADLNGCVFSDNVSVSIQPLPQFDLGPDFGICDEIAVRLIIDRNDVDVIWQDGTMGTSFLVEGPGQYVAEAMTDLGCVFIDEINVTSRECTSFSIYVPDAFSPNNDGRNDFLTIGIPQEIQVFSYTMKIFDRWGNNIYATNSLSESWDGRFKSNIMSSGVYTYAVEVNYSDDFVQDRTEFLAGSFTLIK